VKKLFLNIVLMLLSLNLFAASTEKNPPDTIQVSKQVYEVLHEELITSALVYVDSSKVKFTQSEDIEGILEAVVGSYIFQISEDASLSLRGDLFYSEKDKKLTPQQRANIRRDTLNMLDEKDMIIYEPIGKIKHTITAFIDVDCEHCTRLHQSLPRLRQAGIRLRYLAFPRLGLEGDNYEKTISLWCDKNRQKKLDRMKDPQFLAFPPEKTQCKNPVSAHFYLGESFKVDGTPTLLFDDGTLQKGFLDIDHLMQHFKKP
jgi:thiol:disulfide interchange protein DsbC